MNDIEHLVSPADLEYVVACPVCASTTFNDIAHTLCANIEFLTTSICTHCCLIFRRVRPNLDWFRRAWAQREAQNPDMANRYDIKDQGERIRYRRYAGIARVLGKFTEGREVLDVGCGPGTGLKSFRDQGWQCVGVEPDVLRAKIGIARYGLDVRTDDIEHWASSRPSTEFDLVTVIQVLEHFHEPCAFLQACVRHLKLGGFIYIEVPDATRFINWRDALYLEHMNNFSEKNLILLAANIGLEPRYRLYPRTRPFGVTHLGLVFQKAEGSGRNIDSTAAVSVDTESLKRLSRTYFRGLPAGVSLPLTYRIDRIVNISTSVPNTWIPFREKRENTFHVGPGNKRIDSVALGIRRLTSDSATSFVRKGLARMSLQWPSIFVDYSFFEPAVRPFDSEESSSAIRRNE